MNDDDVVTVRFNERELATVLHGLRLTQEQALPDWQKADAQTVACRIAQCIHFNEAPVLAPEEIDDLCERINVAIDPAAGFILYAEDSEQQEAR